MKNLRASIVFNAHPIAWHCYATISIIGLKNSDTRRSTDINKIAGLAKKPSDLSEISVEHATREPGRLDDGEWSRQSGALIAG